MEFHSTAPGGLEEGLRALLPPGPGRRKAGEFSKGLPSGNIDVTQAEAVIDLIEAEPPGPPQTAVEKLDGSLRRRIEGVYGSLLNIASQFFTAVVDYPGEDIETSGWGTSPDAWKNRSGPSRRSLPPSTGGRSCARGSHRHPGAGLTWAKSSLLNALVATSGPSSPTWPGPPGTPLEGEAVVGGVLLRLIDTAGIRTPQTPVERLGVDRHGRPSERAALTS